MSKIIHLTAENFETLVIKSCKPILVDFWAEWCAPCRSITPLLEEFSIQQNKVSIAKINVQEYQSIAGQYNVMSIPTLLLFKEGRVLKQVIGADHKAIKAIIEEET